MPYDCVICGDDVPVEDRIKLKTPDMIEGQAAHLPVCDYCMPMPGPSTEPVDFWKEQLHDLVRPDGNQRLTEVGG